MKDMKILRRAEVMERIGVSNITLWRWIQAKKFPAPLELGANTIGWLESDIDDWITSRVRRIYEKGIRKKWSGQARTKPPQ